MLPTPFLGPRQQMLGELYCFRLVRPSVRGHSYSVILNRIASTNLSFKFEYGFCRISDNQGGRQNGRHLSISAVVVTLTRSVLIGFLPNFIYELLSSPFRSSSNMGFVRHTIIKMADKMATAYQCLLLWSLLSGFYRTQYPASYTHKSLGRSPQFTLPASASHADVFVVPFIKISNSKVIS